MRKKMNFGVLASAAGLALLSAAALLTSCAREEDGGDPDGFVTMSVKARDPTMTASTTWRP